jgi:hypothetical protein
MNWHDSITADPTALVGKPVIRGTRLAVEFVPNSAVRCTEDNEGNEGATATAFSSGHFS